MTAQDQLAAARKLLEAKRWDEARKLLAKIDHPKAREWLDKLNDSHPPKANRRWLWVVGIVVLLVVVVVAGVFIVHGSRVSASQDLYRHLFRACLDGRSSPDIDCSGWSEVTLSLHRSEVEACDHQSQGLDAPFLSCLEAEGIVPR